MSNANVALVHVLNTLIHEYGYATPNQEEAHSQADRLNEFFNSHGLINVAKIGYKPSHRSQPGSNLRSSMFDVELRYLDPTIDRVTLAVIREYVHRQLENAGDSEYFGSILSMVNNTFAENNVSLAFIQTDTFTARMMKVSPVDEMMSED